MNYNTDRIIMLTYEVGAGGKFVSMCMALSPDIKCAMPTDTVYETSIKWFELKFGWLFINGYKQDDWAAFLKEKYKPKNDMFEGSTKL